MATNNTVRTALNMQGLAPVRAPYYRQQANVPLSTNFLDTIDRTLDAQQRAADARKKKQFDFAAAMFDNDADVMRVEAEKTLGVETGLQAVNSEKDIREVYKTQLNQRLQEVPEEFRNELELNYMKKLRQYDMFAKGHTLVQARKVEDDAFSTRIANDINTAIENSSDLRSFGSESLPTIRQAIEMRARRQYGDNDDLMLQSGITVGEVISSEIQTGTSEAVKRSVEQQVKVGRLDIATQLAREFNSVVLPADRVRISNTLKKAADDSKTDIAYTLSEQAFRASNGDKTIAMEYIRANSLGDGDIYRQALNMYNTEESLRAEQKKVDIYTMKGQVYNDFIESGRINQDLIKKLPYEDRNALISQLNNQGGRAAVVTDWEAYRTLTDRMDKMTDDQISALDLTQWNAVIGMEQMKGLEARQRSIRDYQSKDRATSARWDEGFVREMTNAFADSKGVNRQNIVEMQKLSDRVRQLYGESIQQHPNISTTERRNRIWGQENRAFTTQTKGALWWKKESTTVAPELGRPAGMTDDWVRRVQERRKQRGEPELNEQSLRRVFNNVVNLPQNNTSSMGN